MALSENEIRKIAAIVSSRLGPDARPDEIKNLVTRVVDELAKSDEDKVVEQLSPQPAPYRIPRKLIVNALGPDKKGLDAKLNSFISGRALRLAAISDSSLENIRSVVAIIDCTDYTADFNRLKFELSSLCEEFGFKAIVQDDNYYGI
jgi:predicted amino acid-binding ACT domain protein